MTHFVFSTRNTFLDSTLILILFAFTILHLFYFCLVVYQFWNKVFSRICCHFKRDIDFCNFNKIFGFQELENCTKTNLINCFLLNARFLIIRCKIEKTLPNTMLSMSSINSLKNLNI